MTPQQFVSKWRHVQLKERSAAQEHFLDLCQLVQHPTPAEFDPTGEKFTFEASVTLTPSLARLPSPREAPPKGAGRGVGGEGRGFADVWKKGFFAWEYKGKHANLAKAYQQLLQYRESLQNPPLLVVSDTDQIVIHTNFTNTIKRVETLTLDDLLTPTGLAALKAVFYEPERLKAVKTTDQVTREAAAEFARLADLLRGYGEDPHRAAHFLIRLLFCLFAEDIELLPPKLFSRLVNQTRPKPADFTALLRQLFQAMASGGWFGVEKIAHFDGGLFDADDLVLELDSEGMRLLAKIATLDWSSMEPSILGTLFERSLDPTKRSQLGAHYTSKEDILLIVEPVLMQPLRRRWAEVKSEAVALAAKRDNAKSAAARTKAANELTGLLLGFAAELAQVKVLDPACGSGNFLYVALKQLLDLWKEVSTLAGQVGLTLFSPALAPSPAQLYGIELNAYAHELAQATVWIGYIQWLRDNGFGQPAEPILKPLHNIRQMDAILAYAANGQPFEPAWPEADVVIGNPPFLGGGKLRAELGDKYTEAIFKLYGSRIPNFSDLVCYWFERARFLVESGKVKRAGLLATNSIRGGANRKVLERIKASGNIFMAWSNRPWILEGAAVRVSMIGFDNGSQTERILDSQSVNSINPDLTSTADLTIAKILTENANISFEGTKKYGPFDISDELARQLLAAPLNPNGRPNSDVVKPWINGLDLTRRPRNMWIIDFGVDMPEDQAALYEKPFEYVRENVKPQRETINEDKSRENWWLFQRTRPAMRNAISSLSRFIVTPRVSKHRLFVWSTHPTVPDTAIVVVAREDDYFFGVLHSHIHEIWALKMGTSLEDRPRYSQTMTLETFPFPWPPGQEPQDSPLVQAIAQAAKELVEKRDNWLNPPDLTGLEDLSGLKDLKQRTLTNLYNQRPTWLDLAHQKLDQAVLSAYHATDTRQEWPPHLSDEQILAQLLDLNLRRAGGV